MTNCEDETEALVRQWQQGETEAWTPLSRLIKHALRQRTHTFFPQLDAGGRDEMETLVLLLFDQLVSDGQLDLAKQSHFHKMCALAMRRILVEIAREHAETDVPAAAPVMAGPL